MIMTIELRNIKLYAFHGCYAEEQLVGNHFIVDADLEVDATCAISSDQVTDALNYVEACQTMQQVMARCPMSRESPASALLSISKLVMRSPECSKVCILSLR